MHSDSKATSEEELADFEIKLQRLRIAYDQYFMGSERREPIQLRSEVQRFITRMMSYPPRNSALRFRFNSLVARFQAFRGSWGRTQREIEAGTYKRSQFRAKLAQLEQLEAGEDAAAAPGGSARRKAPKTDKPATAMDQLHAALCKARAKTGEAAPDRNSLEKQVRRQTQALREKYGDRRVSFRVVVENDKAKLVASFKGD